ncbi:MAG: T9SS type A sorting domain-containing protein [Flavobacterium sp.]|nr:T9SS type A sorting domain-containing protein [Flavobacterium sp.]
MNFIFFINVEQIKFPKMRLLFIILLTFIYEMTDAQQLHHEMISAQGGSKVTESGQFVSYTIGQQSVTGTTSNGYIVQQGFQQSNWSKILEQNTISIVTTVFPNPFVTDVNFSFSTSPGNKIEVMVFDVLGRIVHTETAINQNNVLALNLSKLASALYLVKLSSEKFVYSVKVIKQ